MAVKGKRTYTETQRKLILKTAQEIGALRAAELHGIPVQSIYSMKGRARLAAQKNGQGEAPKKQHKKSGPPKGQAPPFIRKMQERLQELEAENTALRAAVVRFVVSSHES